MWAYFDISKKDLRMIVELLLFKIFGDVAQQTDLGHREQISQLHHFTATILKIDSSLKDVKLVWNFISVNPQFYFETLW